jgi:hypothetical protein
MKIRIVLALCVMLLLCVIHSRAQQIPVGALPTTYNPGFAGEAGAMRIASYSSLDYSRIVKLDGKHWYSSRTAISVDNFLAKIHSGIAITAGYQTAGFFYTNQSGSLAISPKFSFKGKHTFAPFVDFSFVHYQFRYPYFPSNPYPTNYNKNSSGIRTGFLINSSRAYFGLSANIFDYVTATTPLIKERSRFLSEMSYHVQTGYTFQRTPEAKFSFTPQIVISYSRFNLEDQQSHVSRKYAAISLIDLSMMVRYKKLVTGFNCSGIVVGFQNSRLKFQLAGFYIKTPFEKHVGISDRTHFQTTWFARPPYSGSVSLRYIFNKKALKMPGFQN